MRCLLVYAILAISGLRERFQPHPRRAIVGRLYHTAGLARRGWGGTFPARIILYPCDTVLSTALVVIRARSSEL